MGNPKIPNLSKEANGDLGAMTQLPEVRGSGGSRAEPLVPGDFQDFFNEKKHFWPKFSLNNYTLMRVSRRCSRAISLGS